MTFTQTIKGIFKRTPKDAVDNSSNGGTKRFLSKISGAFMLPVSVMAIAGLFLGVGAMFTNNDVFTSDGVHKFGTFIKNLGDPVFGAMPLLFLVAIVISFTDDIGTAVFAGIIGFAVFNGLQTAFIDSTPDNAPSYGGNIGLGGGTTDKTGVVNIFGLIPASQQAKIYQAIGKNIGIKSLNTSIFAGIIIGFIVSWAYKTFHEVELPSMIAFFGGKRFVPFVVIILMIPLALLFLLIWPWIAVGLAYFGEYSGKVHGLDSFLFGFTERALIPFGLHHVFYAPLWWTSAGGNAMIAHNDWVAAGNAFTGTSITEWAQFTKGNTTGDSYIWLNVNSSFSSNIHWNDAGGAAHSMKAFEFFDKEFGINLGRFMQGKFSFMQLGLPAAGLAMIMAAPKENRKKATAIIFPAALTAFVTGVTEPIEFTFVFLAPLLFWGFHSLMAATSFLLMNLFGAHVGMTFSGGIIDTIIYGALPMAKGTNFYWMYVIGAGLAPIYYFVFYWWIKKFNLTTPGRGSEKLFTKADFKAAKSGEADPQALAIIDAYGGASNLVKTANCATRLRFDVKDSSKVSEAKLKEAGAMGVMKVSKTHVQAIFGPKAEVLHGKVKKELTREGAKVASVKGTVPTNAKTTGAKKGPAKKATKK